MNHAGFLGIDAINNNFGTAADPESTTTSNTRTKTQSIEEFASNEDIRNSNSNSNNSEGVENIRRRHPASINIPHTTISDDSDQSTTSSITLGAAFRNADIFVNSLYPSTHAITYDVQDLVESPPPPSPPRIEHGIGASKNDWFNPSTGTALKLSAAAAAAATKAATAENRRKKPSCFQVEQEDYVQQSTVNIWSNDKVYPEGLIELGQIELSVLKQESIVDRDSSTCQHQQQMANQLAPSWKTEPTKDDTGMIQLQFNSSPGEEITGIMPLPDGRRTTGEQSPRGPGAYAMEAPSMMWNPLSEPGLEDAKEDSKEDSKNEESERDTWFNNNPTLGGLAEARPVATLPEAQHFDDEESEDRRHIKKERKVTFLGFLADLPKHCRYLLLILSLGALAKWSAYVIRSIFVGSHHDPATMRIRRTIGDAFGRDYFDSELKEKALHWIVHEDLLQDLAVKLDVQQEDETTQLIQRYSLVAFYFQTSVNQPWSYCNPPQGKQSDVCFYRVRGGKNEDKAARWLSAAHECQWMGLYCEAGSKIVSTLKIAKNNMTGHIPSELAKLATIKHLDLLSNKLSGSLPEELSKLANLRTLKISKSNISGSLPLWINQLSSIEIIHLKQNNLRGSIPTEYFAIKSLSQLVLDTNLLTGLIPSQIGLFCGKTIRLDGNSLSGPVPEDLYAMSNLQTILMGQNRLTGTISTRIGELSKLRFLTFNHLDLRGTIPTEVGRLKSLTALNFTMTPVDGTIPEELYRLKTFTSLDISDTNIGGTISSRLGQSNLETCRLENTGISGTIPQSISLLSNLRIFHANGNPRLAGSVPTKFCRNRLQRHEIVVDCSASSSTGIPAVMCPKGCCSSCCDVETRICFEQ